MIKHSIFNKIHKLCKSKKYDLVLKEILHFKNGEIKKPYDTNLNHAWYLVGDAFYKLGDVTQALDAFERSFDSDELDTDAMLAIANCYSFQGEPNKSESYLKKILDIDSSNIVATYNLGNAFFDQERFSEAVDEYKKIPKTNREFYELSRKNIDLCEKAIS